MKINFERYPKNTVTLVNYYIVHCLYGQHFKVHHAIAVHGRSILLDDGDNLYFFKNSPYDAFDNIEEAQQFADKMNAKIAEKQKKEEERQQLIDKVFQKHLYKVEDLQKFVKERFDTKRKMDNFLAPFDKDKRNELLTYRQAFAILKNGFIDYTATNNKTKHGRLFLKDITNAQFTDDEVTLSVGGTNVFTTKDPNFYKTLSLIYDHVIKDSYYGEYTFNVNNELDNTTRTIS